MEQKEIEDLFEKLDGVLGEAARIANLMRDSNDNCEYPYDITEYEIQYERYSGLCAKLEWDNCGGGCCGTSSYRINIPTEYLFNKEVKDRIKEETKRKKEKEEKNRKNRQRALKAAETRRKKKQYEELKKEFEKLD